MTEEKPLTEAMTLPDALAQALTQAVAHHQAGRLSDAERIYRAILEAEPLHPDANHNIGLLAVQVGKLEEAFSYFSNALKADPSQERFWLSSVDVLIQLGQYDVSRAVLAQGQQIGLSGPAVEALTVRLNAATSSPVTQPPVAHATAGGTEEDTGMAENFGNSRNMRRLSKKAEKNPDHRVNEMFATAVTHRHAGRLAEAEEAYRQVLALDPRHALALENLGNVLLSFGRLEEAVTSYRRALEIKPDLAETHNNLGNVLHELRRPEEAEACYRRALKVKPDFAEAHYNLGITLYDLGRLKEAEASYRRALKVRPDYADAHSNLGFALRGLGRLEEAEASYRRALEIMPDCAETHNSLGIALRGLGRLKEAEGCYRRALKINPNFVEAHGNLGNALRDLERPEEAMASYFRALEIKPDFAETHNNLGSVFRDLGQLEEAVGSYRRALEIEPGYADAHNNLGIALRGLGRLKEAETSFRRALEVKPDFIEAHSNLGTTLRDLKRPEEAVTSYRHALEIKPDYADAHSNLGAALRDLYQQEEAVESCRRALEIEPDYAEAHNNLGASLRDLGRLKEAETSYRRALQIKPLSFQTQVNLAILQFALGDLRAAWVNFEARWNVFKYNPVNRVKFSQPRWRGEPLRGKELLIWGEQGVGDEISGASMLPDVVSWSERCVVECDSRLVDLFARSFPSLSFTPRQNLPTPRTENAHFQIPLISLAGHIRNELTDFPHTSGYLTPDVAKCARWRRWLDGLGPGLKVGLSWTGRITSARDLRHFPPLEQLTDIFTIPGLVFVSLQYDGHTEDIDTLFKNTGHIIHCPPDVDLTNDLDDVAALTATLDAVVAPATAISILAGAMGVPAWMYAVYPAEACVILDNGNVPWCPSIRVVKHRFDDEWNKSLARVADGLREFAEAEQRTRIAPEH